MPQVRGLAQRTNHSVHRQSLLGSKHRFHHRTAIGPAGAWSCFCVFYCGDRVLSQDTGHYCLLDQLDAFGFGLLQFPSIGREFITGSAVNQIDFLGSQAKSGRRGVHRGDPTSHNGNPFAHAGYLPHIDVPQQLDGRDHPLQTLPFHSQSGLIVDPDGQINCIKPFLQQSLRILHRAVHPEFHPQRKNVRDVPTKDILRQPVFRNTVAHHSTGFR